jgi:hypothetical protein
VGGSISSEVVWLESLDQRPVIGGDAAQTAAGFLLVGIRRVKDRELVVLARLLSVQQHELPNEVVKHAAQVVQKVPDNHSEMQRRWLWVGPCKELLQLLAKRLSVSPRALQL